MAKKKMVGIGKTKHWSEGRRIKNAIKKLKKSIAHMKPENQAKILENVDIKRKREGGGKQHEPKKKS